MQINFHVAGTRRLVADLQNGVAKIRPAFDADKTGMKNADAFSINRFQPVAAQALVLPNGLQQALGGKIIFVAQRVRAGSGAPAGVKIVGQGKHLRCFCSDFFAKSSAPLEILNASKDGFACLYNERFECRDFHRREFWIFRASPADL
jgi:hypothetical protein